MPGKFCRYTDDQQEFKKLQNDHELEKQSTNISPTHTLYASVWYNNNANAQSDLGLTNVPDYRIGPFPVQELPQFASGPQPIQPCNGNPLGNGLEGSVTEPVHVFGVYNYGTGDWEALE